jgi:hypothetical protein
LLDDLREGVNLALSKGKESVAEWTGCNQCCGSGSASKLKAGPDPDLDLHQSDKLDPEPHPHQFADDKPKCIEYELI